MQKKKFNLSGPVAFLIAFLVLLVFVPINMIISYYDKVYDMTPAGKYTLNPKTTQLLDDTADKQIDVYFLSELRYLQEVPEALPMYHTLTQLDERENITLTCFDPNENKELAESLDPTGVLEVKETDIFVKCGDIVKKIDFAKAFQTDSEGGMTYAGEELIAGAIYLCTEGQLPVVYFVTGYGQHGIDDEYSVFADEIRADNYNVEELDLSAEDAVPDDASIVYLAGFEKDISDKDRDKLNDYIDNGGAVSIFISPNDARGRFSNLEYLLEKFEITMDYNIIQESNPANQLMTNEGAQDSEYFRVSYPAFNEDYTVDLTTELNQLIVDGMYVAGISHTRSFNEITSGNAMIEKSSIIENLPTSSDNYEYTGQSIPMGGDKETEKSAEALSNEPLVLGYYSYNKQTGSKLFLLGTDDVINTNEVAITTYGTRMLALFSNTWLCNSDIDMGIGNKANAYDYMHFESDEEAESALRIFSIVPIVIALCGVAVWLKRRYA